MNQAPKVGFGNPPGATTTLVTFALAVTVASMVGAPGCAPRSLNPPHLTTPSQSGLIRPVADHANGNDSSDPDTVKPKSDMVVANYFSFGSNNCILLTTTSGKHILIDAGPAGSEQDVLSHLQQTDVTMLDYVIVTCPTSDHIGCLTALLGGMTYGKVLASSVSSPLMSQVERVVHANGHTLTTLRAGSLVQLDDNTTLEVLAPGKNITTPVRPTQDWYENHSLVFRVRYNQAALLFTGDMGPDERSWLYSAGTSLRSSIISGLHHGDRRICDIEFINAVAPLAAVLMCRIGNKSGYPHSETLDVLQSTMTHVCRTDVQSDIVVRVHSDGQINISPARPGSEHELRLSGSKLRGGLKTAGTVLLDNPTDDSDSLGSHESGGLP